MRTPRFVLALTAIVIAGVGLTLAQSDDDIDALNRRVVSLIGAAEHGEALSLAQRSIEMTKARHPRVVAWWEAIQARPAFAVAKIGPFTGA